MNVRFYIDPDSGLPHIEQHNVSENEVMDILRKPLEDLAGSKGSRIGHGQTRSGRYLKVIYSRDQVGDGIFVITAFDLPPKQVQALKRRQRRK